MQITAGISQHPVRERESYGSTFEYISLRICEMWAFDYCLLDWSTAHDILDLLRPEITCKQKWEDIMVKRDRMFKFLICIWSITVFLGCAATQKHESTGEYIDDSVITTKVKSAIFDEPSLKVFQISVKTYQGVVQLSGFVDSAQSVKKAGEVAGRVEGVKEVKNDLVVK
jgi:hypothetical protein